MTKRNIHVTVLGAENFTREFAVEDVTHTQTVADMFVAFRPQEDDPGKLEPVAEFPTHAVVAVYWVRPQALH